MYAAGTIADVASRLHQLTDSQNALDSFVTEINAVWATLDVGLQNKLEREARLAQFRFTGNATSLITTIFNQGGGPTALLDELGAALLDETGAFLLADS